MSLEEQIVEWSASRPRPPWQRAIFRRVAMGAILSEADYDKLADPLRPSKAVEDATFGLENLPQVSAGDPTVSLVSIASLEHVNALASDRPLTFEPTGLTFVYGDNASGKSGYARMLKRIARARNQEEILSDVFRDTALAKPKAALTVMVGGDETTLTWPQSTRPELQRMLFYDKACGDAYIETESDFPYRPSALFVMDGLIQACVAIRSRIEAKLEENARLARTLPLVDEEVKRTEIGRYLEQLLGHSTLAVLDTLIEKLSASKETIDDLRSEEGRLRTADTRKERHKLDRHATKLDSLRTHLEHVSSALGEDAIATLHQERDRLKALQEAADFLAKSFQSELLLGVGTSPWKELWESARLFPEAQAYPHDTFPFVGEEARCVLCQQPLGEEACERLSGFERFVQDDTQRRLREARAKWGGRVEGLTNLRTATEASDTNLNDVHVEHAELARETRVLLDKYEAARASIVDALASAQEFPRSGVTSAETTSRLNAGAAAARVAAEGLSNPESIKQRLAAFTAKRMELELLQEAKNQRTLFAGEIVRRKERDVLEAIKSAATGPITKKILELSEDNITEVVRDTFTRETDRLHLASGRA